MPAVVSTVLALMATAGCQDDGGTARAGSEDGDPTASSSDDGTGDDGAEPETVDGSTSDGASADESTSDDAGSDDDGTTDDGGPYEPTVYPAGQTHSPITPFVADTIDLYAAANAALFEDVFMKTGASSTVSTNTLHCFAGDGVDLARHTQQLQPTLDYFLGGDAAGTTSFDRVTEAAQSGVHAGWAIAGEVSPIDLELAALSPRVALVHYGTNDMGWGATYASALHVLYANMTLLLDGLLDEGVVPIVFGITRRGDNANANRWVATYNAALRGLSQQRQIPFIDMHHAIDPLPGNGLAGDGLHLEAYAEGACVLTPEGLTHGYNVRNLIALQSLERLTAVLVDDTPAPDDPSDPALRVQGLGTAREPFVVGPLPWVATQTTDDAPSLVDAYPACDDADESGPEHWYRFVLDAPTPLRIMVLDGDGVDVDLHLLPASGELDRCIVRDDTRIQGTLAAGTYTLVVDTWVTDGQALSGDYTLLVVACDDADPNCTTPL